jgi:carbamoylphosphate synthase large subunit
LPEPVLEYCEVEVTEKNQESVNRAFDRLFEEVMRRRKLPTASRMHTHL